MRFGLNTFLVSSQFTDAELPIISEFKSFGADVIELVVVQPELITIEKLLEKLAETGMTRPIICGAFGSGRDLRGSENEQQACVDYLNELISLASQTGARIICGPMYSSVGRTSAYTPVEREQQLDQIAAHLTPICQRAADAGITMAFEPLNRFETDCINTIDQALDLIARVENPALKIHMDTFHMNIEEENSPAAIRKAGAHVGHFHASASHRGLLGNDQIDWSGVLSALKDIEYDGDIVMESFSEGNQVIARAAAIWRQLYDSPERYSVEGLNFLKSQWAAVN